MDICKFFAKRSDFSHQSINDEVDNKRIRLANLKQNKNKPRPILLNLCDTILDRRFFLNKKKLKNTGVSTTACLTSKRMELLNNAKRTILFLD